jgi:phosphoribosylformimino-5-aminoimidazole carboxamide ribotide isomerase
LNSTKVRLPLAINSTRNSASYASLYAFLLLHRLTPSDAADSIKLLEPHCSEFLIHAADVEGLQRGIDHELVAKLAEWCSIPVTYAGGGRSIEDLELVKKLSSGKVDLTIGSALDIFGGSGVKFEDVCAWNKMQ